MEYLDAKSCSHPALILAALILTKLRGGAMRISPRLGKGTTVVVPLPIEGKCRKQGVSRTPPPERPRARLLTVRRRYCKPVVVKLPFDPLPVT
jgi:hypothetical protein